jgi:SAM-dependent methyltransferase
MGVEGSLPERAEAGGASARGFGFVLRALPLFSATLGLSAFLLFIVQPMFAKMVLPLLGGAPSVWNTAMVVFQAMLLAGYLYAHVLTRHIAPALQVGAHLALLALAALSLPIAPALGWDAPPAHAPAQWLIGLFAVSLGLPFFAVAANAPLLQHWFSHTRHRWAGDPYFLYAASNLGSVGALVCYPLLAEPLLTLSRQSALWSVGFVLLMAAIAACGVVVWATSGATKELRAPMREPAPSVPWLTRGRWLVLSFVPSSLLLGVTTHISTDVAAAPFLWVLPLALYLVTFVLAFARRPLRLHRLWQPATLVLAALFMIPGAAPWLLTLITQLAVFFVAAMICHGELARLRPAVADLTHFYLWVSLGGVMGGAFTALLAPLLFDAVIEYPLMLALACLLRPAAPGARGSWADFAIPLALALPLAVGHFGFGISLLALPSLASAAVLVAVASLVLLSKDRPLRLALASTLLFTTVSSAAANPHVLYAERNFFGLLRVKDMSDGTIRLTHGTTIHGVQLRDPARRHIATGYYTEDGPFGQVVSALRAGGDGLHDVAVVGLGAGTLACLGRASERWTFYEIDPDVAKLASARRFFTFLSDCPPKTRLVVGDARLTLKHAPAGALDLLILDAFTSDSVPAHLLTREALSLYRRALKKDGVIVYHVSNRHLDLASVVAVAAKESGLSAARQIYRPAAERIERGEAFATDAVVVGRKDLISALIASNPRWRPITPHPFIRAWTDDYSNVVAALLARTLAKLGRQR